MSSALLLASGSARTRQSNRLADRRVRSEPGAPLPGAGQNADRAQHSVMQATITATYRNGVRGAETFTYGNASLKCCNHHLQAGVEVAAVSVRQRQIAKHTPNAVQRHSIGRRTKGFG